MARRLIERGVSFVEVISTGDRNDAGWDTHGNGFRDQPNLCAEVDPAYSTLLRDLKDRGLLENTLVVWMGEFGRTPRIKSDGGRDHHAKGWITCLSGGGVRGGQVIGETDANGLDVSKRPVGVQDLFVSFCKVQGIDPRKEYHTPDDRPLKLVEHGEVISELFTG
jgi:arylsulfatase A-like enzyme